MCVRYHGGCFVPKGMFSTVEDILSTVGDILSTVGDILSARVMFSTKGEEHDTCGEYYEYHGGISSFIEYRWAYHHTCGGLHEYRGGC